MFITENTARLNSGVSLASMFSHPIMGRGIVFEAPNDQGTTETEAEKATRLAAEEAARVAAAADDDDDEDDEAKAAAEAERIAKELQDKKDKGETLTKTEATLLKDIMKHKGRAQSAAADLKAAQDKLKEFDGLDPVELRKLVQAQKDAEKAALEAKGDFDRVKQMMADEHKKELDARDLLVKEGKDALTAAQNIINDLTIGNSFGTSTFIMEQTVLTPAKARKIYGDHFELDNGVMVAYDKPAGAKERTKLVNSAGNPIDFEAAIKKLIESDTDKDKLLKSKLAPGTKGGGDNLKKDITVETPELVGRSRIELALANMTKAK